VGEDYKSKRVEESPPNLVVALMVGLLEPEPLVLENTLLAGKLDLVTKLGV
jgi:hypothetical protein